MKINNIKNLEIQENKQKSINKNQNFKGLGTGLVVPLMDGIERGGLATSFIIQDVGGSCVPRTYNGLHRNEDITGKLNYKEAAEVAGREFITGPSMFAIPIVLLYGLKKSIGKALDVPVKHIEGFSNVLSKSSNIINEKNIKNPKEFKSQFYKDAFKNILTTSTEGIETKEIDKNAEDFTRILLEIENAKSKGLIKNIKNTAVKGSKEDLTAELAEKFLLLAKKSKGDSTRNLYVAQIGKDGKPIAAASIQRTLTHLTNYTDDVLKRAQKLTKFDSNTVTDFISQFTKNRMSGRFLLNLGLLGSVGAFCTVAPKLYLRNKEFPGTAGLVKEDAQQNTNTKSANKDKKTNTDKGNKKVKLLATIAAIALGAAAAIKGRKNIAEKLSTKLMNNPKLQNFNKKFEFDGYNMPLTALVLVCYGFVLVPRILFSRSKDEVEDNVVRDIPAMAALLFGRKAIQNVVSKGCTQASGLALAKLPKVQDGANNTLKKVWNYLRPEKGVSVLSSAELVSKYTNIDKFRNGIVDFCDFITNSGGNVAKVFKSDKKLAQLAEAAYDKAGVGGKFADANSEQITKAFAKLQSENKPALKGIYDYFADTKNGVLQKAKVMNSSFDFLTTFFLVPTIIGFGLPKLAEARMRAKYKNNPNQNADTTKVQAQTQEIQNKAKLKNIRDLNPAFKDFG